MIFERQGVTYALAGTVTQPVLEQAAADLARGGAGSR
jgi:hypothetical protein